VAGRTNEKGMGGVQENGDKNVEATKGMKKEGEGLECKRNHCLLNVRSFLLV
jgi:hypothetical protein